MKNKISDKSERCSFLDRMTKSSRARVRKAKALESEVALLRRASLQPLPPPLVLGDFNIIAELKRRSPAMGNLIDTTFADENQLNAYVEGGASAISILTEPEEFKGCLTDLRDASTLLFKSGIPTLRKDFLTDSYQVLEARAGGGEGGQGREQGLARPRRDVPRGGAAGHHRHALAGGPLDDLRVGAGRHEELRAHSIARLHLCCCRGER